MTRGFNAAERAAVLGAVRGRRTVHDFLDEPVPDAALGEALEAARWAPNHYRTEPWRMYLLGVETQARIAELNAGLVAASRGERAAEIKRKRWLAMPGWMVMTVLDDEDALRARENYAACCCAAQNFMLVLWTHGIGVKWTTGPVTRDERFASVVGFDAARESPVGLFWFGYPREVIEQRRKDIDRYVTRVE